MSLKRHLALALTLALSASTVARPAAARETNISLLGGYGVEVRRVARAGATAYGWGLGTRLETTLDGGLYLGAGFTTHLGSQQRARDDAGANDYRAVRHAAYLGPEIGWEIPIRLFIVRPYLAGGAWLLLDRASVRDRTANGDVLSPYLMPGVFVGHRAARWHLGLDLRVPIATALPSEEAGPAAFAVLSFTIDRR